nr:Phenylpyruvate C(3)-methyltransferase [Cupriavidus sp.]
MQLKSLDTHGAKMDDVYRWTRYVYDWTRPLFLFGRNDLVDRLDPPMAGHVCEMGCGTARNLIRLARRRPDLHILGVDASEAMLALAAKKIHKAGLDNQITLAHGYAESFRPSIQMDVVLFPYSLSMMPAPNLALANAGGWLSRGGAIHMVDFGDLQGWPRLPRTLVQLFLNYFSVYPRPAAIEQATEGMKVHLDWRYGRYCFVGVLQSAT